MKMKLKRCDACGKVVPDTGEFHTIKLNHFVPNDIGEEACSGYIEKIDYVDLCHCCYYNYIDEANALYHKLSGKLRENKQILYQLTQGE